MGTYTSNCLITACTFLPWDATNYFTGQENTPPTPYTAGNGGQRVGIFGGVLNLNVISNTYIGNSAPTNGGAFIGPDGFIYLQNSGNIFVSRNVISNYGFEGIILCGGPNAVVGNQFSTTLNSPSSLVLAFSAAFSGLSGTGISNYFTSFIGNEASGGYRGFTDEHCSFAHAYNCSGNYFDLFPAVEQYQSGGPSAAFEAASNGILAAVCGNTISSAGYGFHVSGASSGAVILDNNFAGVTYGGIAHESPGDSVVSAQVFANLIGKGVTFHAQIPYVDGFGWFFENNTYLDAYSNSVPPLVDPLGTAAHLKLN